jgi:hypothetical protein
MAPSQNPALLITQPMAGFDQKGGCPRPKVGDSQMSSPSPRSSRRPMRHILMKGLAPSSLSPDSRATPITLKKKAPSKARHFCQQKTSPPRRVRSPQDRIQPFVAIMPSEATKGLGAPNEILTYGYVKPQVQWFSIEEDPLTDPFRVAWGLGGYAHRARLHAPYGKKT